MNSSFRHITLRQAVSVFSNSFFPLLLAGLGLSGSFSSVAQGPARTMGRIVFSEKKGGITPESPLESYQAPVVYGRSLFFISNRAGSDNDLRHSPFRVFMLEDTGLFKQYASADGTEYRVSPEAVKKLPLSGKRNAWHGTNFGQGVSRLVNINGFTCARDSTGTVYYSRDLAATEGGKPGIRKIFRGRIRDGELVDETPFPYNGRRVYSLMHPAISPDHRFLYFVSDQKGGSGKYDLYCCERKGNSWGQPYNLGKSVNTPGDELFSVADAGGNLYFSSNGHGGQGGLDIFFVKMQNGRPVGPAFNIGTEYNSSADDFGLATDRSNRPAYFCSTRYGNTSGIFRIVYADNYPATICVKGLILDSVTRWGVDSVDVTITSLADASRFHFVTYKSGVFISSWNNESLLQVTLHRRGYQPYETLVQSKDLRDHFLLVFLQPDSSRPAGEIPPTLSGSGSRLPAGTPGGEPVRDGGFDNQLNHLLDSLKFAIVKRVSVYFSTDSTRISPQGLVLADSVVRVLAAHPGAGVWIAGFTDCKGASGLNQHLSRQRADNSKKILVSKGVASGRILTDYFGDSQPVVPCREDSVYDRSGQQANRRTEIIVTRDKKTAALLSRLLRKISNNRRSRNRPDPSGPGHRRFKNRDATPSVRPAITGAAFTGDNNSSDPATGPNRSNAELIDSLRFLNQSMDEILKTIEQRASKMPVVIETSSDSVLIELYDNGKFDGDSITVIYNRQMMVFRQLLQTDVPIRFRVKVSPEKNNNKLIFFANNEGLTPPNSALMVITDEDRKRTEVSVSSDLRNNTVVFFIKALNQAN